MIISHASVEPIHFDGLQIFDYTAGIESDSSLAFIKVPPNGKHAEAWSRRSDKYYLVTAGSVRFVLEGEASDLSSGDFCLVRQGQRFSYSNERSEDAALVLVHTPAFRLEDDVFVDRK